MNPNYSYWTFDLSPYVFQVKNINFTWVETFWGACLLVLFFAGGFILTKKMERNIELKKQKSGDTPALAKKMKKIEFTQTFLSYFLGILIILFVLQKMHVQWGLRWYSLMYLIGFISVYIGCRNWIRNKTLMFTEDMLMTFITYCIIGMLIGARFAYVFIYNFDYYIDHPIEIVATWEGGLAFHGGIVGVCLAIWLFGRKYKIPFFHITDKIVRVVPIGIGFGRIGNFMNGELWGRPIDSHIPWAIIFPNGGNIPRHPSQIYQSLGEGWGLFLTLYLLSRWKHREGTMSAYFLSFYCLYRFIVEYFRAADVQVSYFYLDKWQWAPLSSYPGTPWWKILTMGQILCGVFFFLGLLFLYLVRNNIKEGSQEWLARNEAFFALRKKNDSPKK